MADIFISYKREDRSLIEGLANALEAENLSVWWDVELPLGKSYAASISKELATAKIVMPVWTKLSIQSDWVQEEANFGKTKGNLIPVRMENVSPPIGFGMIQTADLTGWEPRNQPSAEWIKLVESIMSIIGEDTKPVTGFKSILPSKDVSKRKDSKRWIIALIICVAAGGVGVLISVPQLISTRKEIVIAEPVTQYLDTKKTVDTIHQKTIAQVTMVESSVEQQGAGKAIGAALKKVAIPVDIVSDDKVTIASPNYVTDQGAAVNFFTYSPDGKTAASAGTDGTVRLLDAATGKELKLFSSFGPRVLQVHYSKASDFLAVSSSDRSVVVIDIATGTEKWRYVLPKDIFQMDLSPDDGSIAVLFNDNSINIYQIDGVQLTTFMAKKSPNVYGIAWCPQSDCLLIWGKDGMLEVWDPFKPNLVDTLADYHAGIVRSASFSSDGQSFATVADDKKVVIWDANSGKQRSELSGLTEAPMAIAWSPNGIWIAVETESGKAFVWNKSGGKPKIIGSDRGRGRGWLAFTPDSNAIVLGFEMGGPAVVQVPK